MNNIDMDCKCKECIYYDAKNNMCDGFTYKCECLKAFCPMYETEAMIKRREELMQGNALDEIYRYHKLEKEPDIDVDIKTNKKGEIIVSINDIFGEGEK